MMIQKKTSLIPKMTRD